jgi:hypothetical protein
MCLNFSLLYRRVGAGAGATETRARAHQNFCPELELFNIKYLGMYIFCKNA